MDTRLKFFDFFLFNNELDMLEYRLETLYSKVDYFLLVESPFTHAGNKKDLNFEINKSLFKKYSDKIVHSVFDNPPHKNYVNDGRQWENEISHRNDGFKLSIENLEKDFGVKLDENDFVGISDLDEIWNPECLDKISESAKPEDLVFTPVMDFYYYSFKRKMSQKWYHPKITRAKHLKSGALPNDIRLGRGVPFQNGGWHLSYFGNAEFIKAKLEAFAHQEFNTEEIKDKGRIEEAISKGLDLFGRNGIEMGTHDYSNMPPQWEKLQEILDSKP